MKYLVFVLLLSTVLFSNAQITLIQSDFPVPSLSYVVSHTSTVDSNLYLSSGASQTWDFTGLFPLSQDTVIFESPNSSAIPFTYIAAFNNPLDPEHKATVALSQDVDNGMPMLTLSDVYNFYKLTSDCWIQVGMGAGVNSIPMPILWNPTDTILRFPVQYGDQDTAYSAYNMDVPNVGYYGEDRMRVNEVNGYGTLITPYGTFDALKVTSTIFAHDSLYSDSMGFGFAVDRIEIEYKWFAHGYQMPVLRIVERTGMGAGVTVTYIDSLRNLSLAEIQMQNISFYPNPVVNTIKLSLSPDCFPLQLNIFNIEGQLVFSQKIEDNEIDLSALSTGVYMMQFFNEELYSYGRLLKE